MMPFGMTPRTKRTLAALRGLLKKHPQGVTTLQLAQRLKPGDHKVLRALEQLEMSLPGSDHKLNAAAVKQLHALAIRVEKKLARKSPKLGKVRERIVRAAEEGLALSTADIHELKTVLEGLVSQDVTKRVSEARKYLEHQPPDADGFVTTVKKDPQYRFVRESLLSELDVRAIRALYLMLLRIAWRDPIGDVESSAFIRAQICYRCAAITGIVTNDEGIELKEQGVAMTYLSRHVQDRLMWTCRASHKVQDLFNLSFERCPRAVDPDRTLVTAEWAEPIAADLTFLLDEGRNLVLHTLNPLFEQAGRVPLPLIARNGEAKRTTPHLTQGEMNTMHHRLHEFCFAHVRKR